MWSVTASQNVYHCKIKHVGTSLPFARSDRTLLKSRLGKFTSYSTAKQSAKQCFELKGNVSNEITEHKEI